MSEDILKTIFLRKEKLADRTWIFYFEKHFKFFSGQYITVFLNKDSRDFTISSSPLDKEYFTFVTKEGVSDFKKKLFLLKPRDTISIKYPAGGFILQKNSSVPHVFIAGGIGITPFYSMILDASQKKLGTSITLLVSFSKKSDVIFYEQLQRIAAENPSIKIVYSLSNDAWKGEMGRISEDLIKKFVPNIQEPDFFVAGGEEMTYDTEELLLQMGVNSEKIRLDIFTGY